MTKAVFLTTAVLLLWACSATTAPKTTSYLLPSLPADTTVDYHPATPVILLAPVTLDSLLENRGIVYQTSATETIVARQHFWAQSLSTQLSNRLLAGLRRGQSVYWIVHSNPQINTPAAARLLVSFRRFNGSYEGNAQVAGEWTLLNGQGNLLKSQPFSYQEPLDGDGYTALVDALSRATDRLVAELSGNLTGGLPTSG